MIKRRKASAGLLAALYALFLLIPQAAIAAIPAGVTAHCLSEVIEAATDVYAHHHAGPTSDHEPTVPTGGTTHDHSADQECCGLFGLNVLLPPIAEASPFEHRLSAPLMPEAVFVLSGHSPPPIDRPPRHLLHV